MKTGFRPGIAYRRTSEERLCPTAILLSLSVFPVLPWEAFRAILPASRPRTLEQQPFVAHLQARDLRPKRSKTSIWAASCLPVRGRLQRVRLRSRPEYLFPLARRPSTSRAARE